MIYLARHKDLACAAGPAAGVAGNVAAKRAGILRRIYDAIMAARQRQADRDIARFITRSGGLLTDDIERAMTRCRSASFGNVDD